MERLARQIKDIDFDWYVAITRGGLIPVCLLAQITGVTNIDTFCATSYGSNQKQGELKVRKKDYSHLRYSRVLLIDDLVDSGDTLSVAKNEIESWAPLKLFTAVIYKKSSSTFQPDFYIELKPADKWIDFPWEKNQTIEEL